MKRKRAITGVSRHASRNWLVRLRREIFYQIASMSFETFLVWLLNTFRRYRSAEPRRGDLVLGVSADRHSANPFVILPAAVRPQHLGILGLSGSGKTYFIERLIRQDIQNRTGFVVFDVHGDLADNIIGYLAERASIHPEIYDRTVILEPFDPDRSFGFNPLERVPDTSPFFQAQEFAYMLRQRWNAEQFSPRVEELLRNSFYTLSANHETLLRLPDLLTQKPVRDALIRNLESTEIRKFWTDRFDALSAKMQAVYREPILSRLSSFLTDPQSRDIVGQASTFSFREAMRNGHWIVVNLSKGRLGENSTMLGSLLFTKLELDIMSLASVPEKDRALFSVYADEIQNLASDSFGRLIAEARKYRVALIAGHQFWKQLDVSLRQSMLAVGSKVLFRLHYHDAVELAGELAASEKNRYLRQLTVLGRGEGVARIGSRSPILFTVPAHKQPKPTAEELRLLKTRSAERYTRSRHEIHAAKLNEGPLRSEVAAHRKLQQIKK